MRTERPVFEEPVFEVAAAGPCRYRNLVLKGTAASRVERQPDEEEDERVDVPMDYEGSEWVHRMKVAPVFFKFLIGTRGQAKQKLERESQTFILVPGKDDDEEVITIRSRQKGNVYSAIAQIELLLEKEEERLDYTHFLSIPLTLPHFAAFKAELLGKNFSTISPELFMPEPRLHFTLCMLRLYTPEMVEEMRDALRVWAQQVGELELTADLRGLHYMNDDPREVNVLFTTDTSQTLLMKINAAIDELFVHLLSRRLVTKASLQRQRLLSTQEAAEIKLHATLLNTKYRPHGGPMDCQHVLQSFENVSFGHVRLDTVHLSVLREKGAEGYYKCVEAVKV